MLNASRNTALTLTLLLPPYDHVLVQTICSGDSGMLKGLEVKALCILKTELVVSHCGHTLMSALSKISTLRSEHLAQHSGFGPKAVVPPYVKSRILAILLALELEAKESKHQKSIAFKGPWSSDGARKLKAKSEPSTSFCSL